MIELVVIGLLIVVVIALGVLCLVLKANIDDMESLINRMGQQIDDNGRRNAEDIFRDDIERLKHI